LTGANVDELDCTGKTALLIGLQEGREKSCVYLIRHGCEVNIVDKLGQTALYLATHTTNETSNSHICKKLISAGYKIEKDSDWLSKDLFNNLTRRGRNILCRIATKLGKKKTCKLEFVPEETGELDIPNFRILNICS